ncbi:Probable E3 ubiquitin-protein ligase LOG2 [Galdieria sulphuraria]|uniref:RING-type E3 ubiquitin transferase n=1 Tax=Galdieria sulphuraria TaxID=130081 RepID=M2XI94_GALSU|nr:zinc finger (C3HC4-type RING finger) family protein [Galdieria sulphuraria]EME29807.1 zinc finger (C3HC4-type RING finger) family protein [Galdieria sulphuraria]GJD06796.1 Probable E3 ubiquitin-protein ligase LOG2 [Galdieria sulphuraria]|eukprot:XP_005706327.1 zinc finger (C3HC4-type RING finger) family protein [Galdieria sulphuraria]
MGNRHSSNGRNDILRSQRQINERDLTSYRNHIPTQESNREIETTSRERMRTGTAQLLVEGPLNTSSKIPVYFEKAKPITLNLRKETLRTKPLPDDPGLLLLEFIFDASVAGYITVYYFAKQVSALDFTQFEGKYEKYPGKTSFQPGSYQFYRQKPAKGLKIHKSLKEELFYDGGTYFPLVIVLESRQESFHSSPVTSSSKQTRKGKASTTTHATAQLTFGTFVRNPDNSIGVKCLKQQIVINGDLYQLEDIFGLEEDSSKSNQLCLICMLDSIDTLLLPCRHLCLCIECAERIRVRSSCCPLCRHPIAQILQIHSRYLNKE